MLCLMVVVIGVPEVKAVYKIIRKLLPHALSLSLMEWKGSLKRLKSLLPNQASVKASSVERIQRCKARGSGHLWTSKVSFSNNVTTNESWCACCEQGNVITLAPYAVHAKKNTMWCRSPAFTQIREETPNVTEKADHSIETSLWSSELLCFVDTSLTAHDCNRSISKW